MDGVRCAYQLQCHVINSVLINLCFHSIVNSFLELVPYLFSLEGVKVFLSERLCQDPLERFFGCQRQRGGTHENPTVQEFFKNTQALRVINSFCIGSIKGNCRGARNPDVTVDESENTPLPKRKTLKRTVS